MGWKQGRTSLEKSRTLNMERQAIRDVAAQLKTANENLQVRMEQVSDDYLRETELWSKIASPSETAKINYATLRTEIREYLKEYLQIKQNGDEDLRDAALAISTTRKTHTDELLTLTSHIHQIFRSKLENDIPRCRDILALREQAVIGLRELVQSESLRRTT